MIHVELDRIYSEDDAVRQIRDIIDSVDRSKEPVVVTRSNKPRVVIIDIEHIEELTGKKVTPITPMAQVMAPAPDAEPLPTPAEPMVAMPEPASSLAGSLSPAPVAPSVAAAASDLPDIPAGAAPESTAPTLNLPTMNTLTMPSGDGDEQPTAPAAPPMANPSAISTDAQTITTTPNLVKEIEKPVVNEIIQEGPDDPTNSSPLA